MGKKKSRKKSSTKTKSTKCPHCVNGPETFRYINRLYKFDVDLARKIVLDGRAPVELEPDDVKYSVEWSRIYPEHLAHVDVKYPGIIAHYWYPESEDTVLHGHVLIDGHHRAARTLELGVPFYVYLLSEEESRRVIIRAPHVGNVLCQVLSQESAANVCV